MNYFLLIQATHRQLLKAVLCKYELCDHVFFLFEVLSFAAACKIHV